MPTGSRCVERPANRTPTSGRRRRRPRRLSTSCCSSSLTAGSSAVRWPATRRSSSLSVSLSSLSHQSASSPTAGSWGSAASTLDSACSSNISRNLLPLARSLSGSLTAIGAKGRPLAHSDSNRKAWRLDGDAGQQVACLPWACWTKSLDLHDSLAGSPERYSQAGAPKSPGCISTRSNQAARSLNADSPAACAPPSSAQFSCPPCDKRLEPADGKRRRLRTAPSANARRRHFRAPTRAGPRLAALATLLGPLQRRHYPQGARVAPLRPQTRARLATPRLGRLATIRL